MTRFLEDLKRPAVDGSPQDSINRRRVRSGLVPCKNPRRSSSESSVLYLLAQRAADPDSARALSHTKGWMVEGPTVS